MTGLYPLKLSSVTKSPIWSGERLSRGWKKGNGAVGESWELCVRKNENSVVENGELCGKTLAELIDFYGAELTGSDFSSDGFPLLIKLIDAGDDLSVQVHPDDAYAARVENDRGKTEMWYIVEADEGASIVCGLRKGVSKDELCRAIREGWSESVLNYIPVSAGQSFFIPAGLPHAIGRGILIAEVQQNCDLTYRIYDYGRVGVDGCPRELHVEKALDVMRDFSESEIRAIRYSRTEGRAEGGALADCEYFKVRKICVDGSIELNTDRRMLHLLVLSGEGVLSYHGIGYRLEKGASYLLPASLGRLDLTGELMALISE